VVLTPLFIQKGNILRQINRTYWSEHSNWRMYLTIQKRGIIHPPHLLWKSQVYYIICWAFLYFILLGSLFMQIIYACLAFLYVYSFILFQCYWFCLINLFIRTAEKVLGGPAKKPNNQTNSQQGGFRWSLWCIRIGFISFFLLDTRIFVFLRLLVHLPNS
jgi:hypothetical protein